jgi:hypothetical protein
MKIVRNNIIPFKGYKAMNLFGILFVRKSAMITDVDINHECIHTAQMKEMLYVPFYIWYVIEWLLRLIVCLNIREAYRKIGFEKEAYNHEHDMKYLSCRKHYSWIRE